MPRSPPRCTRGPPRAKIDGCGLPSVAKAALVAHLEVTYQDAASEGMAAAGGNPALEELALGLKWGLLVLPGYHQRRAALTGSRPVPVERGSLTFAHNPEAERSLDGPGYGQSGGRGSETLALRNGSDRRTDSVAVKHWQPELVVPSLES